jgi:hypothetical protein
VAQPFQAVRKALAQVENLCHQKLVELTTSPLVGNDKPIKGEGENPLPLIIAIYEALAKLFLCHPERSEGSQPFENTRFFAQLRMTTVVNKEFCKGLLWH